MTHIVKTTQNGTPLYPDEHIQWHLATTKYDHCSECDHPGPLILVSVGNRQCWKCPSAFKATAAQRKEWLAEMKEKHGD